MTNPVEHKWYERIPLVALAPMEAVTDLTFRSIVRNLTPDVVLYTEFVSASGLVVDAEAVWKMAEFTEEQRPIVIQLYDNDIDKLAEATALIAKNLRPDGIDLNMGCPVKKVVKRGAGCGMMATPEYAAEIIARMVENADGIPVSFKTRLGIRKKDEVVTVAQGCIDAGAEQATIHARLKADRPRAAADWEAMSVAAQQLTLPVMGNGDVWSEEDAVRMVSYPGINGVMIARGAIGNPWLLKRSWQKLAGVEVDPMPSREERGRVALEHLRLNVERKGERRGVLELRGIVRNYIKGYRDTRRIWMKIIESETYTDTAKLLEQFAKGSDELAREFVQ